MKYKKLFLSIFSFVVAVLACSCSSSKGIPFADYEWRLNDSTKYVHDKKLSWVFNFDNYQLSNHTPLLGSNVAIDRYPGLRNFLAGVIADCGLDVDSVLLYVPTEQKVVVTYRDDDRDIVPSVYTSFDGKRISMLNVFDMNVVKDDRSEMYTNVYLNKGKKRLVAVDRFPYGRRKIAMITILQTPTKEVEKIAEPFGHHALSRRVMDYSSPSMVEPVGWDMVRRKNISLLNYDLGQKLQKLKDSK